MKNFSENIISTLGWLGTSFLTAVVIGFILIIIGLDDFWYDLPISTRIIVCLIVGYFFWFPNWDKRIK